MTGPFITRRTLGEAVEDTWATGYILTARAFQALKVSILNAMARTDQNAAR